MLHQHEADHDEKVDRLCRHVRLALTNTKQRALLDILIAEHLKYHDIHSVEAALTSYVTQQKILDESNPKKLSKSMLTKLSSIAYAYRVVADNKNKITHS